MATWRRKGVGSEKRGTKGSGVETSISTPDAFVLPLGFIRWADAPKEKPMPKSK
jgi:hypothetical protein